MPTLPNSSRLSDRTVWSHGAGTRALLALAALIFALSFAGLSGNVARDGISAAYSDPISKIRAQDESIYVSSAMTMARDGDWPNPKVMGRLFFLKPPMLMWMSALSIRIFGLSLFSVRLPSLIAGALGIAIAFFWCASIRSVTSGIVAAVVLFLDPLWQTLARLTYTDVLASAFSSLVLVAVALDPRLEKRSSRVLFGVALGAAVLTKSIAGFLPWGALLLYCVLSRRGRPGKRAVIEATLVAVAVIAPWHIYQFAAHPQWFWAEYVQAQLLRVGVDGSDNGVFHRSSLFWIERLIQIDPVLAILAVFGFVQALRNFRTGREPHLLVICWMLVTCAALAAFQSRNLPYLALLLPALCIFGCLAGPGFLDRKPFFTAIVLALLFLGHTLWMGAPWSGRPPAPPIDGAGLMRSYYHLHRAAELIVVQPDDEFYSATLPLPRVRYCYLDPSGSIGRLLPYYSTLGIALTADQFLALPHLMPGFEAQFRRWHADGSTAIGSAIVIRSPSEIDPLVRAKPESDFYLPVDWTLAPSDSHQRVPASSSRIFLLSRSAKLRPLPVPRIPQPW